MTEKSELNRQIASSRASAASAKSANNDIDGRIERLTHALDQVNGVYQDAKRLCSDVSGCDPGGGWKGDHRDTFDREMDSAKDVAQNYANAVNAVYDSIKDKIRDLNNEKNDNLGIIGDCEDVINNCINALQKLVHSW